MTCRWRNIRRSGNQRELDMGNIIEFPADAESRRLGSSMIGAPPGTILILPVIRIERPPVETKGGSGGEQGTAPGRGRRRRT